MKKCNKWVLATGVMLMLLTGCQAKTEESVDVRVNDVPEGTSVIQSETVNNETGEQRKKELELSIVHEKGRYMSTDGSTEIMSIDIATPRITGGTLGGIDTINAWSEQKRAEAFAAVEGNDQLAEGEINNYLLQLANEDYRLFYADDMFQPFYYEQGYSVSRFDEKVLSLTDVISQNSGGAHGINTVTGRNMDMQTGKILTIQDICTDVEQFTNVCEAEICKQIEVKKNEGIEFNDDYLEYVRDIIIDDTFYLTNNAVGFISQEYMLQPYVAGTIYFEISYEELGDLFNEVYLPNVEGKEGAVVEEEVILADKCYELDFGYDVATPMLNKILPRIGLSYMYENNEKISALSDELMVGMIVSAITEDFAYDETWYEEALGGYRIPQDVFEQYAMELFGKTVDLNQFEANQQLGMAIISENHECIAMVGDWGLSCPMYEISSCEVQPDGSYVVNATYGEVVYDENVTSEFLVKGEFVFTPCSDSKYGYVISQMKLTDMK